MNVNANDVLDVIYNEEQWRLSKVSPMYNLVYDDSYFRHYTSTLYKQIMNSIVNDRIFVLTVEELLELKFLETEPNAIKITLEVTSSLDEDYDRYTLYSAILMTWGVSMAVENAVHLPYMLERGEETAGSIVKSTLSNMFQCRIETYNFTRIGMTSYGLTCLQNYHSSDVDPVVLCYTHPHSAPMSFFYEIGELCVFWNGIRQVFCEADSALVAYNMLVVRIHEMLNQTVDLATFRLDKIVLPNAEISHDGVVSLKTPSSIHALFFVLNMCI